MKKIGLLPRLLLGIVLGVALGQLHAIDAVGQSAPYSFLVRLFVTFNQLFGTLLQFLIPLLIVSFVAVGLGELGKKANRLFGLTLVFSYCSTVLAGLGAYALGRAVLPGLIDHLPQAQAESAAYQALFTLSVEPVFGVMTALALAFLLGMGVANGRHESLLQVLREFQEIISKALGKIIIPLIPFYVAGQFCQIAAEGRLFAVIGMLLSLFLMILLTQVAFVLLQFAVASAVTGKNQFGSLPRILPAYLTALGTQSSAATIPVSLECAKKNGVAEDVADFCIPLCATIHLAGDTICLVLGAMGIMLSQQLAPELTRFVPFILMLGITMVAAPGVPGGGVMAALGLIASLLGFTEPMQQLLITLHFSQDSFGTATNVSGDQALALIVDRWDHKEGAKIHEGR